MYVKQNISEYLLFFLHQNTTAALYPKLTWVTQGSKSTLLSSKASSKAAAPTSVISLQLRSKENNKDWLRSTWISAINWQFWLAHFGDGSLWLSGNLWKEGLMIFARIFMIMDKWWGYCKVATSWHKVRPKKRCQQLQEHLAYHLESLGIAVTPFHHCHLPRLVAWQPHHPSVFFEGTGVAIQDVPAEASR